MTPDADSVLAGFRPATSVFYLDISENVLVPKLIKYIQVNGSQCSPFLDKNVTHLVTDKAKTMAEVYPIAQKWNITVWSVEQFATVILNYMDRKGTKVTSPTLHRVISRKRDLSQFLEEEKRHANKPAKTTTPQFAHTRASSSTTAAAASESNIAFVPFEAHYVMIEDAEGIHCPIFKEYPTHVPQSMADQPFKVPRMPYPVFYWDSPIGQCPFIPPLAPQPQPPSQLQANQPCQSRGIDKKENLIGAKDDANTVKTASAVNGKGNQVPEFVTGAGGLRARALRNSTARIRSNQSQQMAADVVFEPAMTDTSILTTKTTLQRMRPSVLPAAGLKITPNISVSVNRATASTPKHPVSAVQAQAALRNKSSPTPEELLQAQQQQRKRASAKQTAPAPAPHRPRPGFCECCYEKYSDLEKHVKTAYHRNFATQSDNYEGIDAFLGSLKRALNPAFIVAAYNKSTASNGFNSAISCSSLENLSNMPQKSPISPSTTNSAVTAARNYTGTKKLKQSLAAKRLKALAETTTSSLLDEEDAAATVANATNQLSSPSCKRRRSQRAH